MSQLAELSGDLQALVRRGEELDRRLAKLAAEDLARLRGDFLARTRGPGAEQARRALAMLDVIERDVVEGRRAIAQVKACSQQWLAQWGAGGGSSATSRQPARRERSGRAGAGAGAHAPGGAPEEMRRRIELLVQEANGAGRSAAARQATIGVLRSAVAEASAAEDGGGYHLVHAWRGEKHGARNAYAAELRAPQPNSTYVVLGAASHVFLFRTDQHGRTIGASTTLTRLQQPRAPSLQEASRRRKGGDSGDDAGHLLGGLWGGPGEEINIVPQDWYENRAGQWRHFEAMLDELVGSGEEVRLTVEPRYGGDSQRPQAILATWARRAGPDAPWKSERRKFSNAHAHGPRPYSRTDG
jgi:hypothetical protein